MMPLFDEAQVRSVLRMEDLIPAMERALIDFSTGRIAQAVRELLPVEPHGGYFAAMPAAGESAMGAKLVTSYPGNAAKGLPTHLAIIVLFRPETGEPLAMMDGRLITEMRTAAVSAVATRALAAPRRQRACDLGQRCSGAEPRRGAAAGARLRGDPGLGSDAGAHGALRGGGWGQGDECGGGCAGRRCRGDRHFGH